MRIFGNYYELISEIYRDLWEMGWEIQPDSMQNVITKNQDEFLTKEIINYNYCLTGHDKEEYLFMGDKQSPLWCVKELLERVSGVPVNPGDAWMVRKHLWEQFLNEERKFDYTYASRMYKTLPLIIQELRKNPNSRQCVISIWDPNVDNHRMGGKARIPCSVNYQFLLRNNQLNIVYNQRSCDLVTHFGNDVWLAYNLMGWMADKIGVNPGYLYHNITSLHCYKKDWHILKLCIDNIIRDKK